MALVTHWLKSLARLRRHRREARMLTTFNQSMLADLGISRAHLNDAFSGPFWEDPTALLRERAIARRLYGRADAEPGFHRLRTDRPARQSFKSL